MSENWRTIEEFPDYAVSDRGRVKRVVARPFHPCRRMALWKHSTGCLCVSLARWKESRRSMRVHILVATAFLPNPLGLPTVNHKYGDKTKNTVADLEWASSRRQIIHAIKTGLHKTRGYSRFKATGRWRAYIGFNGKQLHLGYFKKEASAKAARQAAEKIYHQLEAIS